VSLSNKVPCLWYFVLWLGGTFFYGLTIIAMKLHSLRQHPPLIYLLVISTLLMAGCSRDQNPQVELKAGFTHQEVRRALGEPDEIQEFVMPNGAFFGPQEALSGLVLAGRPVEEWRYKLKDEVMYVWFYGDSTQGKDAWRLIATTIVPKDAIY
jgi:hypothetical protein